MTAWRNVSIGLGLVSCWLLWRDCHRPSSKRATAAECERIESERSTESRDRRELRGDDATTKPALATGEPQDGVTIKGFHVPGYAMRLLPQSGESLLAYRDRIVPLAQLAIAPHRTRVARGRDNFAELAHLDARQKAELDAAVQDAARDIQDRVLDAALGGELSPSTFKPMTGVGLARDVLDIVDRANKRFLATLDPDQRAQLSTHPFDVADYLVFATRWEDALGYR
jgi:hypothetical protein